MRLPAASCGAAFGIRVSISRFCALERLPRTSGCPKPACSERQVEGDLAVAACQSTGEDRLHCRMTRDRLPPWVIALQVVTTEQDPSALEEWSRFQRREDAERERLRRLYPASFNAVTKSALLRSDAGTRHDGSNALFPEQPHEPERERERDIDLTVDLWISSKPPRRAWPVAKPAASRG
jgi:hypothetical protein